MEVYVAAMAIAVFVYLILKLILDNTAAENIKRRLRVLSKDREMENIHDEVMKEKKNKTRGERRFTLISKKFEENLAMSGIKLNAQEYLKMWLGATIIPVLLMLLLGRNILTAIGAGVIGFAIPPIFVQNSKKKRQQLFNKQLNDSLIVMSNCLKSGYSFQQSMESIATDMQPPIATEFTKTLREIRYGVRQEDALNHMVERVKNKDLGLLVSAVVTSTQVGGNLSEIMDTISSTIKDRIKIRDDIRVLSAQGRISGVVIGLIPVAMALLLMLVNPEFMLNFLESDIGKVMIGIGVVLEAIGFAVIRKIVDIEY